MATSNFYLYNSKANAETLIILHFRHSKEGKLAYSTRQKIHPKFWNFGKQRAKEVDAFAQGKDLNILLNRLENEVFNIYRKQLNNVSELSNELLRENLHEFLNLTAKPIKPLEKTSLSFRQCFEEFINDSISGKRLQKDGSKIADNTIKRYHVLKNHLFNFSGMKNFELHLPCTLKATEDQLREIKTYWKSFYTEFSNYLLIDLNQFDNSTGTNIKALKTFLNYVKNDKEIAIGDYFKSFYVRSEVIPIICLEPAQLSYLINDITLEQQLPERLKRIKDIFVFGCTVGLRVSDLLALTKQNLTITANEELILNVRSKKTDIQSTIKLPQYAVDIISKYKDVYPTLLPSISDVKLNLYLKELGSYCKWNNEIVKVRQKRGIAEVVYKDNEQKTNFTFSELLTTHCMRRTAITVLLRLGVPERVVKSISGHAPNSVDFYKYVELSRSYVDSNTEEAFKLLAT